LLSLRSTQFAHDARDRQLDVRGGGRSAHGTAA
jgi:hypothetical protein